ncbi:MAG: hypothetical protein V4621_06010 [Pseudomonadota bacterium]
MDNTQDPTEDDFGDIEDLAIQFNVAAYCDDIKDIEVCMAREDLLMRMLSKKSDILAEYLWLVGCGFEAAIFSQSDDNDTGLVTVEIDVEITKHNKKVDVATFKIWEDLECLSDCNPQRIYRTSIDDKIIVIDKDKDELECDVAEFLLEKFTFHCFSMLNLEDQASFLKREQDYDAYLNRHQPSAKPN